MARVVVILLLRCRVLLTVGLSADTPKKREKKASGTAASAPCSSVPSSLYSTPTTLQPCTAMATAAQLTRQLQESTHAWNTLTAPLQPWQSGGTACTQAADVAAGSTATSASSATATATASAAPFSAAALRCAHSVLRSLHLDALFHAHVRDELLAPFIRNHIIAPWWEHVEKMQVRHTRRSGAAQAARPATAPERVCAQPS